MMNPPFTYSCTHVTRTMWLAGRRCVLGSLESTDMNEISGRHANGTAFPLSEKHWLTWSLFFVSGWTCRWCVKLVLSTSAGIAKNSGCFNDAIGFDECLMSTFHRSSIFANVTISYLRVHRYISVDNWFLNRLGL